MKRNRIKTRLAAAMLSAVLLAAVLTPAAYADDKKDDLQQNVDQAQQNYDNAQDDLEQMQQGIDSTQQQIDALGGQIDQVQSQALEVQTSLNQTKMELAQAQQDLAVAQQELEAKQAEYDKTWSETKNLMSAMQRMHDGGGIALLSQATNLYELLTFSNVLDEMNSKCDSMLTQLEAEEAELDAKRQQAQDAATALETAQSTLENQQSQLESLQGQLSQALQEQNSSLTQQQADMQAQQTLTADLKKQLDAAEAELDAYVRQQSQQYNNQNSSAPLHCSLDFICPLNSYSYISTYFKGSDPWGRTHNGTDFAAAGGTPIHAAADGVVSVARLSSSYGNYVQISHGADDSGNTYDTLYAHMTYYVVSVGQHVSKGDVIGYVGSTGWSTGNHLHLELRVNGNRVDPLSYIPH